jgi:hypothetical protein
VRFRPDRRAGNSLARSAGVSESRNELDRVFADDTGADTGTPVDDRDYRIPFKFTGTLNKLTLTIDRPKLSPEDIKRLKGATATATDNQ